MKKLNQQGDDLNPKITFDDSTSTLRIEGRSIPLEVDQFFSETIQWLEQYAENPNDHTKLEIDLKYMNGKSVRSLLMLLYKLKSINDSGKSVNVEWYVPQGADDLKDLSEELLANLHIPHDIRSN